MGRRKWEVLETLDPGCRGHGQFSEGAASRPRSTEDRGDVATWSSPRNLSNAVWWSDEAVRWGQAPGISSMGVCHSLLSGLPALSSPLESTHCTVAGGEGGGLKTHPGHGAARFLTLSCHPTTILTMDQRSGSLLASAPHPFVFPASALNEAPASSFSYLWESPPASAPPQGRPPESTPSPPSLGSPGLSDPWGKLPSKGRSLNPSPTPRRPIVFFCTHCSHCEMLLTTVNKILIVLLFFLF